MDAFSVGADFSVFILSVLDTSAATEKPRRLFESPGWDRLKGDMFKNIRDMFSNIA